MRFTWVKHIKQNSVAIGVIIMLVGDFMFAANDAMGKWLVGSFSVGQVVFIRSIGAFIILAPLLTKIRLNDIMRPARPVMVLFRVVWATGDTVLFYAAVQKMPLADVMTFYMAGPIYVAAISHFFLSERLGWRRWLAIFIGFCGVVITLQPSSAMFTGPACFAILSSISFALVIIFSRILRSTGDTVLVTWQTVGALIVGLLLSLNSWQWPTAIDWTAMLLLGVVSCTAHLLIARSLKLAPAAILAPLQYTLLLWAIIFGIIFFGNYPALHIIVGAGIIVFAGLFIFHRKRIVAKENLQSRERTEHIDP